MYRTGDVCTLGAWGFYSDMRTQVTLVFTELGGLECSSCFEVVWGQANLGRVDYNVPDFMSTNNQRIMLFFTLID